MATQMVLFGPQPPALPESAETCSKCRGTGEYRWGTVTNGVPAKRGMCFQCRGKGFMTLADINRTSFYWDHRPLSDM